MAMCQKMARFLLFNIQNLHLLLAAAGVDPLVGLEGYYRTLETTHKIGTSEYFI